jgi:hypothetical protein
LDPTGANLLVNQVRTKKEGQPTGSLLKNTKRCTVLCAAFLFNLMGALGILSLQL